MRVQNAAEILGTAHAWYPAIDTGGGIRDGAWAAEATHLVDLSAWTPGTRLVLRKERPHPGAQLGFTDSDGHRVTGFLTDTADGRIRGQLAGLELRHRQHARVTDRSRGAKATGLPGPNCSASPATLGWVVVRSPHSATGSCTPPPASPAAP